MQKSKKAYCVLLKAMKITLQQLMLAVAFLSMSYAVNLNAQELLSKRVSLSVHEMQVEQILDLISRQTKARFIYSAESIKAQRRISVDVREQELEKVLTTILTPLGVGFNVTDRGSILLKKLKTDALQKSDAETVVEDPVDRNITGRVTDEKGEGLPGVSVVLKGTQRGTITTADGSFELAVPEGDQVLIFSFVGYLTQEIAIGNRTRLEIRLEVDQKNLEEVVVVGYGTVRKSDLTGAVGSVDEKTLRQRPVSSLGQALSGTVPGVNVSVNSGRPGGRVTIRVRGNTSISGSNAPLYVVDGIIMSTANLANGGTPIDYLDPGSIESVEVLKDASATAIYGARGANGVILITTKKGSAKGNTVSYEGNVGFGVLPKKIPVLNSEEFLRLEETIYENAKKFDPNGTYQDPRLKRTNPLLFDQNGKPLYDTDWQKEATQVAVSHTHRFGFTGGNENGNYGLFLTYREDEGILKQSWMKRYAARFTVENKVRDWLRVGGNVNYNFQDESEPRQEGDGGITPTRVILQALPITPVRYPDGTWGKTEHYPGMEGGPHYLEIVDNVKNLFKTNNLLGNIYASATLAEGLELRSSFSVNLINQRRNYYAGGDLPWISRDQKGIATITQTQDNTWQFENYLTYRKELWEGHQFTGLLGASWQKVNTFSTESSAQGFLDDYYEFNNLGVGSNPRPPASASSVYSFNSYFGRINYSLKDRYLATLTGRIDGSSKFGSNNKYAFFPSAALGWNISNEDFFQQNRIISRVKLRTSYGLTGNSEIANYRVITGLGNYSYIINNTRMVGVGVSRIGNRNLQWESNAQFDAGIEIGLFDERLSVELDVYRRKSSNMLLEAPIPASSGYTTVLRNIGSMENKGLEVSLTSQNIRRGDVAWTTQFNASYNRNKVLKLTRGADIIQGTNPIVGQRIIRENEPVNSFFGLVKLGTWSTQEEEQAKAFNKRPGDNKYLDVNNDGAINDKDKVIIGNGNPDWYGSLVNTVTWKDLDLMIDLQFMLGNDVAFETKATSQDRVGITNVLKTVLDAWTPENQNTMIAQVRPSQAGLDRNSATDRIYDGSFLRGRNIVMGYNGFSRLLKTAKVSNFRVYASLQNLFVITSYPGYDPEVSSSLDQFAQGVDLYAYPKPRTFLLGLIANF